MIINPTKKTVPLFDKLKQTEVKEEGKAYSDANPFFSWHANYITVDRKKVVLLVNDRTLLPLLINNVNAKVKPKLDKVIETGIREMFSLIGVPDEDIDTYFKLAGDIEINAAYNRKTLGHIKEYLYLFEVIDLSEQYPFELSLDLAGSIQTKLKNFNSIDETLDVFTNSKIFNDYSDEDYQIEKDWKPFSEWAQYADEDWFEGYDDVADELRENNNKLLSSFESYLRKKENMSKAAAEEYASSAGDYLNTYLVYYRIATVLTDMFEVQDFLGDFYTRKFMWADEKSLKHTAKALRKLYGFLYEAEEITEHDLKLAHTRIEEGTMEGLENFKLYLDLE